MTTALSLASELVQLTDTEQQFLRAMLAATPVARRGASTLVPMKTLKTALGLPERRGRRDLMKTLLTDPARADDDQRAVVEAAQSLMTMRKLDRGDQALSFALVDQLEWVDNATFLQYQLSSTFLDLLHHLATKNGVELF